MKTASASYKMLRALGGGYYEIRVIQGNKTYGLDTLKSVKVHNSLTNGDGLSIGGTNAAECEITVVEQSSNWERMASFTIQFRLHPDGAGSISEWITVGTFYTDQRKEDESGNLTIIGYDGMLLTEQYWADKIPSGQLPASFPITARAFCQMVQNAGLCSFEDLSKLDNSVAFIGLDTKSTIRDKLKDIATAHGGNWQMTQTGSLRLVNFKSIESSFAIAGIAIAGVAVVGVSDASSIPEYRYPSIGRGMMVLSRSPVLPKVSGVTLENEEGISVTAGSATRYMAKGMCEFSTTEGVAELCLTRMQGYSYKPFSFKTVELDPIIDVGDILIADGEGYQIMDIEWTFSKQITANISAPYDQEVDHEYKIINPETKTYRKGLTAINKAEARLESSIQQTAEDITLEVSRTYETKSDASGKLDDAKEYTQSQVKLSADSIKSTVAAAQKQYDTENYTVTVYGYGVPNTTDFPPGSYTNAYYLNQSNGALYRSNGSSWSKVKDLSLISAELQTQIVQTADTITSTVSASQKQYNTESYTVSLYGYGAPTAAKYPPASYNNQSYLNQSNGALYKSNGSSWSKVKDLNLISASLQTQITQNTNSISAKVSKSGGTHSSFGWEMTDSSHTWYANNVEVVKMTSSGVKVAGEIEANTGKIGGSSGFIIKANAFYSGMNSFASTADGVYIGTDGISLGGGKFKVDKYGNLTATSGTFTSSVYAKDIIVESQHTGAGYITGGMIGSGEITGGTYGNIDTHTIEDINVGSHELSTDSLETTIGTSLGYADFFNAATGQSPSTYPDYFTAARLIATTSVRSPKFLVPSALAGEPDINLHAHYHSITVDNNGDVYFGAPINTQPPPFNVADTRKYQEGVSAATLTQRTVLSTDSSTVNTYSTNFNCTFTASQLYTPSGTNYTYGRVDLKNAAGNILKTLRIQIPKAADTATVSAAEGLASNSSNYTTYDKAASFAASSIYTSGSTQYARIKITLSNGNTAIVRAGIPASSSIASIQSASTDADYSDYYYSGGRWKLYVHAKDSNGNTIFTDTIDVQRAVDYGAQSGATGHVEVTSTSGNSAFIKMYDSSWNALKVGSSSVGKWITAGTSETFGG